MSKVVTQSRAYDAVFDSTFTTPFMNSGALDARVRASISKPTAVGGSDRFKYSRRPIMPRLNAVPPQILLAPTVAQNPMKAVEEMVEPEIKEQGVQTVYRESEAQTVPYAPDYFVPEGTEPEVLLLKGLTHDKGLPVGQKEVSMIENARRKQELECNLPPFTDEGSLMLRKRLMEFQELREFKLREGEVDANREARLQALTQRLAERDEANEFLVSQRLESTRQSRMAEKERAVQKLRSKRIKILRRLATRRNRVDVMARSKDIISSYFDKTSAVYAPAKRDGSDLPTDLTKFDVHARTAPLNNLGNIVSLESTIPVPLLNGTSKNMTAHSATTGGGGGLGKAASSKGGGKAAEDRLTSAAVRSIRNTKRDVEEMHNILLKKKLAKRALTRKEAASRQQNFDGNRTPKDSEGQQTAGPGAKAVPGTSSLLSKKPKGRPSTPDLISDAATGEVRDDHLPIASACILLQRLLRGRAIQNTMHEARIRRKELIAELREVDVLCDAEVSKTVEEEEKQRQTDRATKIRETTVDAIVGSASSNVLGVLSIEQDRREAIAAMTSKAEAALEERHKLEAAEAGFRQRFGMNVGPPPKSTLSPGSSMSRRSAAGDDFSAAPMSPSGNSESSAAAAGEADASASVDGSASASASAAGSAAADA